MRPIVTLLLVVALAGCASKQTFYYTLAPTASAAAPVARAEGAPALVAIGPVAIPDYVDRAQIVLRKSDHSVDHTRYDQWAGSLDDMLPRVLVENMSTRLPRDNFVAFPQSGDLPFDYRVPITISRFDVSTTGEAVLVARWQIRGKAGAGALVVHETVARAQAVGVGFEHKIEALSRTLGVLTDDVSAALASMPRARAARRD